MKAAIAASSTARDLKAEIVRKAVKALSEPPFDRKSDDFLGTCRKIRKRLQSLGLAWLLDRDERYAERARRELAAICAFPDWNPAHFLDTAELIHAVAIGYDWFHDKLSEREKKTIADALIDKGLEPGFEQLTSGQKRSWPNQATNWNIVCNAGLMIGALAVAERGAFPWQVFERCLDSVPTGFRGYSPDGSWDEGPGYWSYATEYAAYLLSALRTALDREYGLANLPGFAKTGFFRMHAQGSAAAEEIAAKFFNFSDCEEERNGSWCMRWLYHRFKEPLYNLVALNDAQSSPMDLFWFSPDAPVDDGKGIPRNVVFRGLANVAMLRGDSGKGAGGFRPWVREEHGDVYLGIRAGANSRDGVHAHLDLGGFVLDASDIRWAVDIPPFSADGTPHKADYALPGYFDVELERRFRYYRTSTFGHNTLVINGFNQPLGVETEVISFGEQPKLAVVVLDLTAAYPDCLRVRRGFALIEHQHVLIVDELTPKQDLTVRWQMHTRAKVKLDGQLATLTQEHGGVAEKFFVRILEPADARFTVDEARGSQPKEGPNDDVRKLVATVADVGAPARIAVLLSTNPGSLQKLPDPLTGFLWSWIEWAEEATNRKPKGRSSYKEAI